MSSAHSTGKKRVITTLPGPVVEELDRLAKQERCSRDALVGRIVTAAVEGGASVSSAEPAAQYDPSIDDLAASMREFVGLMDEGLEGLRTRVEFSIRAQEQVAKALFGSFLPSDAKADAKTFLTGLFSNGSRSRATGEEA